MCRKKYGIVSGYSDGTFKPYNYITYPESAKILVRSFYNYDIPASAQLTTYTQKIDELDIVPVTVKSAGDYNSVQLKRGEMASLVYGVKEEKPNDEDKKYFGSAKSDLISFDDALNIAEMAVPNATATEAELQMDGALFQYEVEVGGYVVMIDAIEGVVVDKRLNNAEDLELGSVSGLMSTDDAVSKAATYASISDTSNVEVELEKEGNTYIYVVEMKGDDMEVEVEVNAKTGKILGHEYGEMDVQDATGILSRDQILSRALANSFVTGLGTVEDDEIELKQEDGHYIYVVTVEGENDEDIEFEFNAVNGNLIALEYDMEDDEEDDNDDEDDDGTAGSVTRAEAEEIALAETGGGTVDEVDIEDGIYEIVIEVNGQDREVGVDSER